MIRTQCRIHPIKKAALTHQAAPSHSLPQVHPTGFEPVTFPSVARLPAPSAGRISLFKVRDYGGTYNFVKPIHTGAKTRESTRYRWNNPVETGSHLARGFDHVSRSSVTDPSCSRKATPQRWHVWPLGK